MNDISNCDVYRCFSFQLAYPSSLCLLALVYYPFAIITYDWCEQSRNQMKIPPLEQELTLYGESPL